MASEPKLSKSKVYQTFNLKEMFGTDFSDLPELRAAIGQKVINIILDRTAQGKAIGGNKDLAGYSPDYIDSLEFKAAGKSKNQVNMALHGDMLGLLDIIDEGKNTITIGWDDETQIKKAYNHNVGDTVTKRPFFGLSAGEQKALISELKSDVKFVAKDLKKNGPDDLTKKALDLLDSITNDDGG